MNILLHRWKESGYSCNRKIFSSPFPLRARPSPTEWSAGVYHSQTQREIDLCQKGGSRIKTQTVRQA